MDDRQCRICLDTGGNLVTPCRCRGTQAYIHSACLRTYFMHYPDGLCRVCQTPMKRINPDELHYGIAGFLWILALSYSSTLPIDQRGVYLILAAGCLTYYFAIQAMPILLGLCAMGLSSAFLLLPYDIAFQLLAIASVAFLGTVLCLYVPVQLLLITMALVLSMLYSSMMVLFALARMTPLIASILSCCMIFIWYLAIRARPPQRNVY